MTVAPRVVLDRAHRCPWCGAWLFWCEHYDVADRGNRYQPDPNAEPPTWPATLWVFGALAPIYPDAVVADRGPTDAEPAATPPVPSRDANTP